MARRPVYPESAPVTKAHAAPTPKSWKFCSQCVKELKPDYKRCPYCGIDVGTYKTIEEVNPKNCGCGYDIRDFFIYCPSCKEKINQGWKDLPACGCRVLYAENAKFCVGCARPVGQ